VGNEPEKGSGQQERETMTRKDYETLAKGIAEVKKYCDKLDGVGVFVHMTREIATNLQIDNPRFDKARFYEACGL